MAQKGNFTSKKSLLEKILSWGIVGIFLILPLLYFPNWAASYVTSKQYFVSGAVDVLAVVWVWLLLQDVRYRLSKINILLLLPLLLFLASLTISAIVGIDPATSFLSIVESGTGLLVLYHIFLLACVIASAIRVQGKQLLKYILQANLFASVVLAIATFFTGPNGLVDIHSKMLNGSSGGAMMGNSLLAGAYFIFSLFLTLYLMTHESDLWRKIAYWASIVTIVFSPIFFNVAIFKGVHISSSYLFIGQARIATVALLVGLFLSLFIWLCTRKDKKLLKTVGISGVILMIAIGGIAMEKVINPTSSLHTFFVKESGNRIIDWQASIQGLKARPLFGWGPENFHAVYQQYLNPIVFSPGHGNEVWALHPHNNTFEVLITGGVVGLLFYLIVLIGVFYGIFTLYKKQKIDTITYALLIGMLVAFLIQQQMIYDSIVSYVMFFFTIAVVAGLSDSNDQPRQLNVPRNTIGRIGIVVVMLPIFIYAVYLPAGKVKELQQIAAMTNDKRTVQYQHLFHSPGSYAISTDPEFFTGPLYYSYSTQEEAIRNNPSYQKAASQEIQALLNAVDPIWQSRQYDYHLTLSLIQLENLQFYLTGEVIQLAQADKYAQRAVMLSPTDPQIYTAYAQTLVYEKNEAAAKKLLEKAIALNQNYQSATSFYKVLNTGK